jgi:hypothetical protein
MRCLLIAPLHFYGFASNLGKGLEARGYEVVLKNDEYPTGLAGRLMGFFLTRLIRRSTYRAFAALLDAEPRFDLVLIIKGRGMSPKLIQLFEQKAARVVAYNYDSFTRNPASRDWFRAVKGFRTFDIKDARDYDLPLVHLFSAAPEVKTAEQKYLVSVIQRLHSDRLRYAKLIVDAVPADQRFVFLYEWSKLTLILGFLRSPRLYMQMWGHISFDPLPYDDAMARMAASKVTFDFAFPGQSGITVRCFEAQSLGTAILTNNMAAVDSGLFEPGSIAYMPEDAEPETVRALLAQLAQASPAPATRTLNDFLDDLLSASPRQ